MIDVAKLCVRIDAAGEALFEHVNLRVSPGETVALMGESGVGKSTLGRALVGQLPARLRVTEGRVTVAGCEPLHLRGKRLREFRKRVSYIDQDPGAALTPHFTVRRLLAERAQVDPQPLAAFLEIEHLMDAYPAQLSGGQRRRVALARGLVSRPEAVIFDEPTAGLDAATLEKVCAALAELEGAAKLVITHDLEFAQRVADRIVRIGPPPQRVPKTRGEATARGTAVLQVRGLDAGHAGQPRPQPLDVTVHAGEVVALTGPSGCGKTTLLRAILGLHVPDAGSVAVQGVVLAPQLARRSIAQRRGIGWVPQDAALSLNPAHSVARILRQPDIEVCTRLGIEHLLDRRPGELSGGQRQRVLFAAAIALRPPVLLLDEATAALDPDTRDCVLGEVDRLCEAGTAVLAVSHEDAICQWADRVIALEPS